MSDSTEITRRPNGRPTRYTDDLATLILTRMSNGEALKVICAEEGMPDPATVRGWAMDDRCGFSLPFARARELQADAWVEDAVTIADDDTNDVLEREVVDGKKTRKEFVTNHAAVTRSKLRAEIRLRVAGMLVPHKYGPNVTVRGDAMNPLRAVIDHVARTALPLASDAEADDEDADGG